MYATVGPINFRCFLKGPLYEELPSRSSAKRESKNSPPHQRQILRTYWATFLKVVRYQPMDHIRGYYGEQVALYFSWLGQVLSTVRVTCFT